MVLSDVDIRRALDEGRIKLDPFPDLDVQLGPCSIDLRLGPEFRVFEHSRCAFIDVASSFNADDLMRTVEMPEGAPFVMQPGEFVLAASVETIELPDDLLGRLEGRSSLARIGIIVHGTAPRFDPGWRGKAVMELGNIGRMPVLLRAGMAICSMTFEQLTSPAASPYRIHRNNKYLDQAGPVGSRLAEEVRVGPE